jgi:hypothetical protein
VCTSVPSGPAPLLNAVDQGCMLIFSQVIYPRQQDGKVLPVSMTSESLVQADTFTGTLGSLLSGGETLLGPYDMAKVPGPLHWQTQQEPSHCQTRAWERVKAWCLGAVGRRCLMPGLHYKGAWSKMVKERLPEDIRTAGSHCQRGQVE